MHVGVIGLGIMGAPMARNLRRAGHRVSVFARTPARVAALVAEGMEPATSPAAMARTADAIVTSLPDSPDVEAVLAGSGGILEGARPGLLAIDTSTIAPGMARELAALAGTRGVALLDAPVSGGEAGAIAGMLSIMVGGSPDAFARAGPVFAAIGKRVTYMGASGQGQMTKLVNQVVGATTLAAAAEGVLLAERAGLDPAAVVQAIGGGAATSWQWENQAPRMQRRDFAPGFMIRLQQKDLRLALAAAEALGVPLPATTLVHQLLAVAEADGGGELGTQALLAVLERLSKESVDRAHPEK